MYFKVLCPMSYRLMSFLIILIGVLYLGFVAILYFFQEKMIFFPTKLATNYNYHFEQDFEEITIKTLDNNALNSLLFKAKQTKGVVFYLHGNAGSLKSWGEVSEVYTSLGYDLFIMDYRGYGKSSGKISNENQFYNDVKLVYKELISRYKEEDVIIIGNSIGTGVATRLASESNNKLLILQAPYYNFKSLVKEKFSLAPSFVLKYQFRTNDFLPKCKMPVLIFHGKEDQVISHKNSLKLEKLLKPNDQLVLLENQGHNGMNYNKEYFIFLQKGKFWH